jgi:hypothetical protein
MLFELRQYRIKPERRDEWVQLMEDKIIPFQISQGMVVTGSFVGEQEPDLYVWIRRFADEQEREALYTRVYDSDYWKTEIAPHTGDMIDRERTVVTRLIPTPKSVIR